MLAPILIHKDNKPAYTITFNSDYSGLASLIDELKLDGRKVCIVSDSNVAAKHLENVIRLVSGTNIKYFSFIFEAGESNKNTDTIDMIYEKLISEHFDRNDVLFALGGGVTGDMTGFAAATYLRGIKFVQIPTSLLAMVDSSIGGKTGVDYKGYKNMVGAFHMPSAVYINTSALNTLPEREYISGFAEIIKHALIKDSSYFDYLYDNADAALSKDTDIMTNIIHQSCRIKQSVVEEDPTEQGIRAYLNFGHTLGHAIEKYMNFTMLHGECISLGSVAALYISYKRGLISENDYIKAKKLFELYKLPVSINESININDIIDYTKNDKKADGDTVKFILIDKIGNAFIDKTVSRQEMFDALLELTGGRNE